MKDCDLHEFPCPVLGEAKWADEDHVQKLTTYLIDYSSLTHLKCKTNKKQTKKYLKNNRNCNVTLYTNVFICYKSFSMSNHHLYSMTMVLHICDKEYKSQLRITNVCKLLSYFWAKLKRTQAPLNSGYTTFYFTNFLEDPQKLFFLKYQFYLRLFNL